MLLSTCQKKEERKKKKEKRRKQESVTISNNKYCQIKKNSDEFVLLNVGKVSNTSTCYLSNFNQDVNNCCFDKCLKGSFSSDSNR